MKSLLTKSEGKAFQRQWKAVHRRKIEELRKTPPLKKFQQFCVLMATARGMGWIPTLKAKEKDARKRWIKLKDAYKH